jgi:hypothetical protein
MKKGITMIKKYGHYIFNIFLDSVIEKKYEHNTPDMFLKKGHQYAFKDINQYKSEVFDLNITFNLSYDNRYRDGTCTSEEETEILLKNVKKRLACILDEMSTSSELVNVDVIEKQIQVVIGKDDIIFIYQPLPFDEYLVFKLVLKSYIKASV